MDLERGNIHGFGKMDEFFNKRVNMYDDHMLNEVEGCREGYKEWRNKFPTVRKSCWI